MIKDWNGFFLYITFWIGGVAVSGMCFADSGIIGVLIVIILWTIFWIFASRPAWKE